MQLDVGKSLRAHRRARGMTQEQAAEALGVSAQAVSRWETGTASPDVTTLAGMAMLYGTSVDTLIGMEALRSADALRTIHSRVQALMAQGRCLEAEELLRDSLRIYPDEHGLLMALGQTLARGGKLQEAIAIGERMLSGQGGSVKARSTAMVNLVFLYRQTGAWEKAGRLVRELPHIWESRELMLPEAAPERKEALRAAVVSTLQALCTRIDEAACEGVPAWVQLGMDLRADVEENALLEKIRAYLQA